METTNKSLYEILNVDKSCTIDDIRKQYKILALKYHPDRNDGDDVRFKQIKDAYDTLSDENKRREYDNVRLTKVNIPDIHDVFEMMFSMKEEQQKIVIRVDLEDILYGCYKSYTVKSFTPCMTCKMTGIMNPDKNTIQCRECFGKGMNPMMSFLSCISCNGKGVFVINNKVCKECNGKKQIVNREDKRIYLKPGIKNNDMIFISNSVVLLIEHERSLGVGIRIEDLDVYVEVDITLIELLCGFVKEIRYGQEQLILQSRQMFRFDEERIVKKRGIHERGDLHIHFRLRIDDIDNSSLYKKIGQSLNMLLKKELSFAKADSNGSVIDIQ